MSGDGDVMKIVSAAAPLNARRPFYSVLYVQVLAAIAAAIVLGHFWPSTAVDMKPLGDGFIKLDRKSVV